MKGTLGFLLGGGWSWKELDGPGLEGLDRGGSLGLGAGFGGGVGPRLPVAPVCILDSEAAMVPATTYYQARSLSPLFVSQIGDTARVRNIIAFHLIAPINQMAGRC